MAASPTSPWLRPLRPGVAAALFVLLAGGCSNGAPTKTAASSPTTIAPPGAAEASAAAPASSAEAALTTLLAAEAKGDHAASYRLLSAAGRKDYDPSRWARRRSELPPVTGFRVETVKDGTVIAIVEHEPGLDPFVGLRPGEERQTWRSRKEGGGWLLDAEPAVVPIFPPAATASEAALRWARAVQACDQKAAAELQAVEKLFGSAAGSGRLCKSASQPVAGRPERLPGGFASQELVAQYGPEVFEWARTVAITAVDKPFHVVLAPVGSVWKVVGLYEP